MTLTSNQAKLYGLAKATPTSNFVRSSLPHSSRPPSKLTVEKMARISRPSVAQSVCGYAKDSERVHCTFKVSRTKAATVAMNSKGCGYDFLTNDDASNQATFVQRMDTFERNRRKGQARKIEEQEYDQTQGKLGCGNCGNLQVRFCCVRASWSGRLFL